MSFAQTPAKINPAHTNNVVRLPLTVGAATIAVRKLRGLTIAEKGLLYTIAAHMPDCRPGIGLLVDETGASRPQLFRLLARLEAKGHLRRIRLGGRYGTNAYELVFQPAETSPVDTQGSLLETSEGSLLETQGGKGSGVKEERADGGQRGTVRRPVSVRRPAEDPVPESAPRPVRPEAVIPPSGGTREREVGDRGVPVVDPSRFELPDVCFEEPATVDREVRAMHDRKDRGERLYQTAEHLVAGFDVAHRVVYGFPSTALRGPKLWKCAVSAATRTLNDYFAGDVEECARYVEWAWTREARAWEQGRRRERPIGWPLVFGVMVGDYLKAKRDRERRAA